MELSSQYQLNLLTVADASLVRALLLQDQLGSAMGLVVNDATALQWALTNWLKNGTWWGIFKQHHLIGVVVIMLVAEQLELSYGLLPAERHRGLMTKAVKQVLAQVAQRPIMAQTTANNLASQRVLQKLGFNYDAENRLWTCN
ncbi:GNAT family N-acetyltransferase [Limosilactobacillus equigenerosi]|uniref:N-acetyltransferase domain-containing protein n=1 Tax=Limosilactobacillus equigenerosi DSM 18793 = JCM 14505 TaxID=1423742 RepID=A0A0R1US96_9LACO|nr:GNAT family N-acetyltransferase [Limosilactobacillus equigenerosi]KRL96061.1 hypothetical protein FC21_GL000502 [Limosilactobacillus equigenerosi DSM 18793 = JCM 14505]